MLLGEIYWQLAAAGLTHTYGDVFHFSELNNIDSLVPSYLNWGTSPFKEWAKEWLHDREVQTSGTKDRVCGDSLIWRALA